MKKVLVYVISCWQKEYAELMRVSKETWESIPVDGVTTYFYAGLPFHEPEDKLVQFDIFESLNTMGRKNLMAYRWALDHLQWDYMARVNASTYVRKKPLLDHCQALRETQLMQGAGRMENGKLTWMWGGLSYIFSRDVVQQIVDNGHKWDHSIMEDVSTSKLTRELGIPWDINVCATTVNKTPKGWLLLNYGCGKTSCEFARLEDAPIDSFNHFIRVKQDLHRDKDLEVMRTLHRMGV